MNKDNLKLGTRVTFNPIDGSFAVAEGEIINWSRKSRMYVVLVSSGQCSRNGRGEKWACRPEDIISVEPKPGMWGAK